MLSGSHRTAGMLALSAVAMPFAALAGEDKPTVGLTYVADVLANVEGGARRGSGWLGRADLTFELPGSAFGWDRVDFFADLMLVHGNDFSERYVQDAQVVSNVDAPSVVRPIEIWANIDLDAGNRLKLGVIDLNGEFDIQEVGGHFINSSHGIGPDFSQSGLNGPSIFPNTSLGAVFEHARDAYSVRLGVFDALPGTLSHPDRLALRVPDEFGTLLVGEGQLNVSSRFLLRLGGWRYTKSFERLDPQDPGYGRSAGAYAMAEGRLAEWGARALDGWARIGSAKKEVNPISASFGSGVTYGSEDHKFGLAVSYARLGGPAQAQFRDEGVLPDRAETVWELTYAARVAEWLQVQPNLQYVVNPGWDRDRENALVVGVRFSLDLTLH